MFCKQCGNQCPDGTRICNRCGSPLEAPAGNLTEKFVNAHRDPLFLTGCVLATVSVLSFNVLMLLTAIFMWVVYAQATQGTCNAKSLRNISGVIYANIVILWVVVGILGVCTLLSGVSGSVIAHILEEYAYMLDLPFDFHVSGISSALALVLVVGFAIAIAVIVLINLLVYKPIHNLSKSMYMSLESGTFSPENPGKVSTILLVLGILIGISALSSLSKLLDFISSGCTAALWIVMSLWLRKHFVNA